MQINIELRFDTVRKISVQISNFFCSVCTFIFKTYIKKFCSPKIFADDPDFGPYGDIAFDLQSVSNNGGEKFVIKHNEGEKTVSLICIGTIQKGDTYVIIVRASDKGVIISRRR